MTAISLVPSVSVADLEQLQQMPGSSVALTNDSLFTGAMSDLQILETSRPELKLLDLLSYTEVRLQNAETIAELLKKSVFSYLGVPEQIHTNQGVQFEFRLMTELFASWVVRISHATPATFRPTGWLNEAAEI